MHLRVHTGEGGFLHRGGSKRKKGKSSQKAGGPAGHLSDWKDHLNHFAGSQRLHLGMKFEQNTCGCTSGSDPVTYSNPFFPGERPYKCPHCDYAGTQSGSLKYHLQRHHREQRSSAGPGPPPEPPPPSQRGSLQPQSGAKPTQASANWVEGTASTRPPSSSTGTGSRRKPASPGRTLRNGRSGEAEPLDLSLRAGPGGETGAGGALHRCLFCPFATGAPELMALHLQVHHSRRARGRRQPRADTSPTYVRAPSGETPPSPPLEEEGSPGLSRSGEAGLGGQER